MLEAERDAEMGEEALEARVEAGHTIAAPNLHPDGYNTRVTWEDPEVSRVRVRGSHAGITRITENIKKAMSKAYMQRNLQVNQQRRRNNMAAKRNEWLGEYF